VKYDGKPKYHKMKWNFKHPVLLAGLVLVFILVLFVIFSETFGAEPNPTGNPLGGGQGYTRIISPTEPGVRYVVSSKEQLIDALGRAQPGEAVFVNANIDLTGEKPLGIPAGVTLAGNRGFRASPDAPVSSGATIRKAAHTPGFIGSPDSNGWTTSSWEEPMFYAMGDGVRVTGLQLEGEMAPQDDKSVPEDRYLVGIFANAREGFEVDNNEIRGWSWSGISLMECRNAYVHHNYIHSNQARGEGYGSNLYGGSALFEANLYDFNRHAVAGAGYPDEGYEARYNIILGNGNATGGHHFDVHAYPPGLNETADSIAGSEYKIHHNTFEPTDLPCIGIRALPGKGVWIDHNIFTTRYDDPPVFQRSAGTFGGIYMTRNYIGKSGAEPVLVPEADIEYLPPPE
jgi:hypothetical protein